jgi:hypothetical protein
MSPTGFEPAISANKRPQTREMMMIMMMMMMIIIIIIIQFLFYSLLSLQQIGKEYNNKNINNKIWKCKSYKDNKLIEQRLFQENRDE